eukprot:TRINITY_DN773_c0_g2_i1.p1 TRINITY_DN773_c0_g2~~TRINITY_DN773_c0_g2_i1.p1  ORF type:complete len:190 (-),score=26.02 TRINITY_DN773_c0_g2_i1:134-703(-)
MLLSSDRSRGMCENGVGASEGPTRIEAVSWFMWRLPLLQVPVAAHTQRMATVDSTLMQAEQELGESQQLQQEELACACILIRFEAEGQFVLIRVVPTTDAPIHSRYTLLASSQHSVTELADESYSQLEPGEGITIKGAGSLHINHETASIRVGPSLAPTPFSHIPLDLSLLKSIFQRNYPAYKIVTADR